MLPIGMYYQPTAYRKSVSGVLPGFATIELTSLSEEGGIEIPTDRKRALLAGCSGSLPVVASLKRLLGIDTLLFSFGLDDDQVHSPNEKFELACCRHGARAHARPLSELAV